jgi:hypothetical protein
MSQFELTSNDSQSYVLDTSHSSMLRDHAHPIDMLASLLFTIPFLLPYSSKSTQQTILDYQTHPRRAQ